MSVISTNITSQIAQQNLNKSASALGTAMQRLSSGMRINSAKDDAAGQAIANRMSASITGLSQAQRNANDGISVAQTAEGGLNQINDNLQRIRELTVQSQNGTNSANDLKSIQAEINQRLNEITRISDQTDFNGTKVLKANQTLSIQVGAKDGETIDISLKQISSQSLGLSTFNVDQKAATGGTAIEAAAAKSGSTVKIGTTTYTATTSGGFKVGSTTYTVSQVQSALGTGAATVTISSKAYNVAAGGVTFATGGATAYAGSAGLTSATTTTNPLDTLDAAIKQVDTLRSDLGAIQNRFDSAITNLQTNQTNLSSARSRIQDADYSVEVANMTKAQILQQAGTSVLAQANQIPQSVLKLLG